VKISGQVAVIILTHIFMPVLVKMCSLDHEFTMIAIDVKKIT